MGHIITLLLGPPRNVMLNTYRTPLLVAGFGIVFFSLVIQGITMKRFLAALQVGARKSSVPTGS